MNTRPLTGSFSSALVSVVLCGIPAHAPDHLIHAWEAIRMSEDAGSKGDYEREATALAFARNHLACARSESVARHVKPRQRKAFEAECAELARRLS